MCIKKKKKKKKNYWEWFYTDGEIFYFWGVSNDFLPFFLLLDHFAKTAKK